MSNGQIEQRDSLAQDARKLSIQKNANPGLIEPFLAKYQGSFLAAPEERQVYYIGGRGRVKFFGDTNEYDGVSVRSWTIIGPSKAYPDVPITAHGGEVSSHLAGDFHFRLEAGQYEAVELPENLRQAVASVITEAKQDKTLELDQKFLQSLYSPIRRLIDQQHDEYWKDRLITFDDSLVLPENTVPATVQRRWYLQPPTRATETIDHTLYFVTMEYTFPDGRKKSVRAVEKDIVIHTKEKRDQYGTALNNPIEMVKKQQFMKAHRIPTYEWAYANESDTRLFVPDLTEGDCEVLDHRIYSVNIHLEKYRNERLAGIRIPDWAKKYTNDIDRQSDTVIKQAEDAGMEILKDCLYIVKRKGNFKPEVIVGDLGQGLFHPDDPNKGRADLRFVL